MSLHGAARPVDAALNAPAIAKGMDQIRFTYKRPVTTSTSSTMSTKPSPPLG